jgi:hypothetical protein
MHGFIMSVIGALIKLLWIFSSAPKENKTEPEKSIEVTEPVIDKKTVEIIEEVSKLDNFLTSVKEAKTPEERLNILIAYEEDEKMKELLIKMRGH